MNKILKTILLALIAVFAAGVLFVPSTRAQANGLVIEFEDDPLFDEANFLPGGSVTRWIKITNNGEESKPIATEAINYPGFPNIGNIPTDDLSRVLNIVIREKGGSDLYGGTAGGKTLFDFYEAGETYLSDVSAGSYKEYEFEISFPKEKENEWQEKTTYFDIIIGSQGEEGGGDDNGGDDNGGGDNGGGTTGGGGSVVWPPGLTITSERVEVTIENCDATISWNTSYNSTSRVIYAPEGGNHIFDLSDTTDDPSKYGYDYTSDEYDNNPKVINHSVTIYSLTPNTTYYYRCISHASPPTISKELSFDTFNCLCEEEEEEEGAVEGTSTVAEATSPVFPWYPAQESGEPEKEEPEKGEVKGTTTEETFAEESRPSMLASMLDALRNIGCLPWWLILILALYPLYKLLEKREEIKRELDERMKSFLKEKQKIWFSWFSVLVILALVFYFIGYWCIALWILVVLILATLGIRFFLEREGRGQQEQY